MICTINDDTKEEKDCGGKDIKQETVHIQLSRKKGREHPLDRKSTNARTHDIHKYTLKGLEVTDSESQQKTTD